MKLGNVPIGTKVWLNSQWHPGRFYVLSPHKGNIGVKSLIDGKSYYYSPDREVEVSE